MMDLIKTAFLGLVFSLILLDGLTSAPVMSWVKTALLWLLALLVTAGVLAWIWRWGREKRRGWRVRRTGRDNMYYEEIVTGKWERLDIGGSMLVGIPHHLIYLDSPEKWNKYPAWAKDQRDEIITRIKSEFAPPGYKYTEN